MPEENTHFGAPLLDALVVILVWLWRRPAVRALAVTGLVFAVLSFGVSVTLHGKVLVSDAPWAWLRRLPLFEDVLPIRFGLVLVPVIALLLASSIEAASRWPVRYRVVWLVALAAVLVPLIPIPVPATQRPATPEFFTSGMWRRYVPDGRSVVSADTTVWYGAVTSMRWDNVTGDGYRMVGGY